MMCSAHSSTIVGSSPALKCRCDTGDQSAAASRRTATYYREVINRAPQPPLHLQPPPSYPPTHRPLHNNKRQRKEGKVKWEWIRKEELGGHLLKFLQNIIFHKLKIKQWRPVRADMSCSLLVNKKRLVKLPSKNSQTATVILTVNINTILNSLFLRIFNTLHGAPYST